MLYFVCMKSFFQRVLSLTALIGALSLTGAGCTKALDPATMKASQPVSLTMWGTIDDGTVYGGVISDYRRAHPNVQISYQRIALADYEQTLLEAEAEDRGPDIFLINHEWTGKYMPRITPMPSVTNVAYSVMTGGLRPQQTWQIQTDPGISMLSYKNDYADAVLQDTIRTVSVTSASGHTSSQPHIMGIPVSLDTMAMFVNKDLLNTAGIPQAPATWGDFQTDVKKLVKLDATGTIMQAAAGIGTAENVDRSVDLLTVLMMQNGTVMASPDGMPAFHLVPPELQGQRTEPPSYQALQFYTDFANPAKDVYTWNKQQPDALDEFIAGKSAFFFGYSYDLPVIRARAPQLNLSIAALPQIQGNPVRNIANYWYWVVAKKSQNQDVSWNFLNFLAQPAETQKILNVVKRPSARKSLLASQANDEDVSVFASQVLTAATWYQGSDARTMEAALSGLINNSLAGTPVDQAMRFAVDTVAQTIHP